jgi:transcription elongation factor GreB
MNKPIPAPSSDEDDEQEAAPPIPAGAKNYITLPAQALEGRSAAPAQQRTSGSRKVVAAASNGRSMPTTSTGSPLREIDRRIRFLTKRLDAGAIDPATREATTSLLRCNRNRGRGKEPRTASSESTKLM